MIQAETWIRVADNSGARWVECFKVRGHSGVRYASVGDVVVASVKEADPNSKMRKKVVDVLIVRQTKSVKRADGSSIRADEIAGVLVSKEDKFKPLGTRVFGPVFREVRDRGFMKVVSMAPEVL